jgi:GNAT superfamily N-acetyltransferase
MIIRRAETKDAEAIAHLAGELGYPSSTEDIVQRMKMLSGDDAVFVAESDGDVVGWIHVGPILSLESGACAEIRGLVVTEARRGSGVGAVLVRAAEDWARGRGQKRLRLRTNVTRTRTHAFYERCGFTHIKTSRVYEKSV